MNRWIGIILFFGLLFIIGFVLASDDINNLTTRGQKLFENDKLSVFNSTVSNNKQIDEKMFLVEPKDTKTGVDMREIVRAVVQAKVTTTTTTKPSVTTTTKTGVIE